MLTQEQIGWNSGKPSNSFLNLENKNRINKNITEIRIYDNYTIKDPKNILERKNFL